MTIQNNQKNTTLALGTSSKGEKMLITLCGSHLISVEDFHADFGINEVFANSQTINEFDIKFPSTLSALGFKEAKFARVTWNLIYLLEGSSNASRKLA